MKFNGGLRVGHHGLLVVVVMKIQSIFILLTSEKI